MKEKQLKLFPTCGKFPAGGSSNAERGPLKAPRFQRGTIFTRGTRRKVYVARWIETVHKNGQPAKVHRSEVLGALSDMSKSEAQRKLQAKLQSINDGTHKPAEISTVGEVEQEWEREHIAQLERRGTKLFYLGTMRKH